MIDYMLSELGIFYVQFKGKITHVDISNYLDDFKKMSNLPNPLLTLYDLRETNLKLALTEIEKIAKKADKVTEKYNAVKTAFIVNDPDLTAYAMLFNQVNENANKKREVFSTEESAKLWLLSK